MKLMWSSTFFCVIFVLLKPAFSGTIPVQSGIQYGPENVAVLAGETTTLTCIAKSNARIRWYEYVTNPSGVLISDGKRLQPNHPNFNRYELTNGSLKIKNINVNDAGYYQCQDSKAAPSSAEKRGAQLIVIVAPPDCTRSYPADGFTLEGQSHTAKCIIGYRASQGIAPLMTWSGPTPFVETTVATETAVSAEISFTVHRSMAQQNWICKTNFTTSGFGGQNSATNAPTWQHIDETNAISVYWPPTKMSVTPLLVSYEVGQTLTCSVDAHPEATLRWENLYTNQILESQSSALDQVITHSSGYQLMRCMARNSVQQTDSWLQIFVDVFVYPNGSAPPLPTTTVMTTTNKTTTVATGDNPPTVMCDDITGQWEVDQPNGARSVLCISVSHEGLIHGQWWNNTNDPHITEISGTTDGNYNDIRFLTKSDQNSGVTRFAGKCRKYGDAESLYLHAFHQSSPHQATWATRGTILKNDNRRLQRVAVSLPCTSS